MRVENREGYQDILAAMRHHYRYISMERGSLTQRRITACTFPEVYTSIIIDCCDKIPLPHRAPFVKAWLRKSNRFSVTTIGLLDHNAAKHLYYYPTFAWPQDPNLILSILWQYLVKQFSGPGRTKASTLYVQADNKVAENKNKYTFCFWTMLIQQGVFSDVFLYFLPPGHTHEDVDQLFSTFKKALKYKSALGLPELLELIQNSFVVEEETVPVMEAVEIVYDWKTFFRQHMNNIHYFTQPRCFHFYRNSEGKVVFRAKAGATNGVWDEEIQILPDNLAGFPQPIPSAALPQQVLNQTRDTLTGGILSTVQAAAIEHLMEEYSEMGEVTPVVGNPFVPMRLLLPVEPNRNAPPPRAIEVVPRRQPTHSAISYYAGLFVAVRPGEGQDDFWIGEVVSVAPVLLRVRWWELGEEGIWNVHPTWSGHMGDLVRTGAVLTLLPTFADDGFVLKEEDLARIMEQR